MSAPTIVIHGPQGSGKTRYTEEFRRHYGCARVFESDVGMQRARCGDLILTNETPQQSFGVQGFRVVHIDDALRAIGRRRP
ncbi:hypothetical protein [Xylophilus ampelinus]|uniref:AAA domain-containing protein n=1 Tax=Xylophilus ampelinus TaxID=54067 RepID=A0A318T2H6_9BURK|nr:hypothetical protein [Xylophilus ampelinus]MCS4509163.1 hypothetical protein [Xylophilus ampelinus]PYE79811.1 hypothetical protein DFQ15_101131 [Xylophilus ampelinus]